MSKREQLVITMFLVGLLLAGCGTAASSIHSQTLPPPELTVEPTPKPIDLVVLHTNDNWGETDPCG